MPDAAWWEALWPDPAGVLGAVGIAPGMEVIDLCAGDGWFTLPIARIARRVVAVELDADLLARAGRRLREGGATNALFIAADAYAIAALAPAPADLVFMANAFHGVPDRPRLARAVRAALAPGGLFVIVNWHQRRREETTVLGEPRGPKSESRLSPEQTRHSVEAAGLTFVRLVELPPYHYGAVFAEPA